MKTINLVFKKFLVVFALVVMCNTAFSQSATSKIDTVLSTVEVEASFPGGDRAWIKYITNAFKNADVNFKKSDEGTCRIKFIVDKNGNISNVEAINMKRTRLARFAIDIIANGPKWKPAQQNNRFVNAFREQPITLTLE